MRCWLASSRRALLTAALSLTFVLPSLSSSSSLHAADAKLGKIFIKAASANVDGQQFADQAVEDTVKDMKKRPGKFVAVDSEAEADFLLVVIERKIELGQNRFVRTPVNKSYIHATLSVREGGRRKPGVTLSNSGHNNWRAAADGVMKEAAEWVEAHRGQ